MIFLRRAGRRSAPTIAAFPGPFTNGPYGSESRLIGRTAAFLCRAGDSFALGLVGLVFAVIWFCLCVFCGLGVGPPAVCRGGSQTRPYHRVRFSKLRRAVGLFDRWDARAKSLISPYSSSAGGVARPPS